MNHHVDDIPVFGTKRAYTQTGINTLQMKKQIGILFFILFLSICLLPELALANNYFTSNNFIATNKRGTAGAQNAIGIGFYHESLLYEFADGSQPKHMANYQGWLIKYRRFFGNTMALQAQYLTAHAEDTITSASVSALYGLNLNGPGPGLYIGVSYSLKKRDSDGSESLVGNEEDKGVDYPVGLQVSNGMFIFIFESRYKHLVLEGANINTKTPRYPLYFSIMMNF